MIDRIAPTRRPDGSPQGFQQWRSLLFLHWPVPVETLRHLVPVPLALDLLDGVAYVGVVPFVMQGVRPRWWPESLGFNFLETNVRTYVLCGEQPGVYFFSLEASSRLAVWGARAGWGLPYHYAHMSIQRRGDEVVYESRRARSGTRHAVRYQPRKELGPSPPGTLEHFLLERYLLFVQCGRQLRVGQVHHLPYPAQQAHVLGVQDELVAAAGLPPVEGPPVFAHYAEGVDVEVFPLRAATPSQ